MKYFIRSFRPDFILVRQHVKDVDCDWRNLVIGFKYGCTASVNNLDSIYNFGDKPWVVSFIYVHFFYQSLVFIFIQVFYFLLVFTFD